MPTVAAGKNAFVALLGWASIRNIFLLAYLGLVKMPLVTFTTGACRNDNHTFISAQCV
jgi:hypothetical protein